MKHPLPCTRALGLLQALALFVLASACSSPQPVQHTSDPWPTLAPSESSVLFSGDVFLGAQVTGVMKKKGLDWPGSIIGPIIHAAGSSAVIGNHEGVIGTRKKKQGPNRWNYLAGPGTGKLIAKAGWTHLSMANNHALDRGQAGMKDTLLELQAAGLRTFGAGLESEAFAPLFIKAGDTRIAVLAGMNPWPQYRKDGWRASPQQPGIAMLDAEALKTAIETARASADVVVLYPHWGPEYKGVVTHQKKWTEVALQLGVDAIIGHHSHQAQPIEMRGTVPIAWNLGNGLFGTEGRFKKGQGQSLLTRMVFEGGSIRRLEFLGLFVDNKKNGYRPTALDAQQSQSFIRSLAPSLDWSFQGGVGVLSLSAS